MNIMIVTNINVYIVYNINTEKFEKFIKKIIFIHIHILNKYLNV